MHNHMQERSSLIEFIYLFNVNPQIFVIFQ